MKIYFILRYSACFFLLLFWVVSCSKSTNTDTGRIIVFVNDNDAEQTPIANVQVTLTPGDIQKQTNENGLCQFDVEAGSYFVNADLCCLGPGFIHYHEPVTVINGDHEEVRITACLRCY